MAEVGRQEIEPDRDGTLRRTVRRAPDDTEAIEGCTFKIYARFAGVFVVAHLSRFDVLDGLQAPASLMGLVRAAPFLPELPARGGFLALLLVFEGHADEGAILDVRARLGLRVDDVERVRLAFVQIRHGNLVYVLDHRRRRVQRDVISKSAAMLVIDGVA